MKKYFLLFWLLVAFGTITGSAQATDTAVAKIAGEWEIAQVVVRETSYDTHVFLKEYMLTDKSEIKKLKAGLLTEIIFGIYQYEVSRKGRRETGEFRWAGRSMVQLSRTQPEAQWSFVYEWEMPSVDKLIFRNPFSVYRDTVSGQLVRADYISHYSRKPKNQ
ncbi:hypothetical protein [Chitinophaga barathri]|uniref:DUF4488 domain-containing protein n=1 Tax=Chitinophaga barathri TaxID=1647451 RepID=A0A3N4M4M6_9BACT|nr:hypothetical protein [Chitinophaga barathri]RPD38062.1 hypothetical protein EG028_26990 [Chitinophaga barathri]